MSRNDCSRRSQRTVSPRKKAALLGASVLVFCAGAASFALAVDDARKARSSPEEQPRAAMVAETKTAPGATGQAEDGAEATDANGSEAGASGQLVAASELEAEPTAAEPAAKPAQGEPEAKAHKAKRHGGNKRRAKARAAKKRHHRDKRAKAQTAAASANAQADPLDGALASSPAKTAEGARDGTTSRAETSSRAASGGTSKRKARKARKQLFAYRIVRHKAVEVTRRDGASTKVTRGACPVCGKPHAHDFTEKMLVRSARAGR